MKLKPSLTLIVCGAASCACTSPVHKADASATASDQPKLLKPYVKKKWVPPTIKNGGDRMGGRALHLPDRTRHDMESVTGPNDVVVTASSANSAASSKKQTRTQDRVSLGLTEVARVDQWLKQIHESSKGFFRPNTIRCDQLHCQRAPGRVRSRRVETHSIGSLRSYPPHAVDHATDQRSVVKVRSCARSGTARRASRS